MTRFSDLSRDQLIKTLGFVAAVSTSALVFTPSMAAAAIDISHKIKIAGDLRMFTQRMVLAASFVMFDVETDHHLSVLRDEYHEFEADIAALRNDDAAYSMEPEANKLVL